MKSALILMPAYCPISSSCNSELERRFREEIRPTIRILERPPIQCRIEYILPSCQSLVPGAQEAHQNRPWKEDGGLIMAIQPL